MANPLGFAIAALQFGNAAQVPQATRYIAGQTGFVTFEEVHTDSLEITDHPIEQGSVISDHAFKRPPEVTMSIGWSNSSINVGQGGAGGTPQSQFLGQARSQVAEIYLDLLAVQMERVPFEVFTGKRYYHDMLMKEIVATTDPKTENVLMVKVTFKHVSRVTTTKMLVKDVPKSAQAAPQSTAATENQGGKQLRTGTGVNVQAAQQSISPTR